MASISSNYPPIKDYGLIGDCGSAALVSRDGVVEWMCWPRFDSPSIFAAILDRQKGGCFRIGPTADATVHRRYVPNTTVLETTFITETGVLRLTDLMPVNALEAYQARMWPDHQLLRKVECLEGEVEVELLCVPRPNYGLTEPRMTRRGELGIFYESRGHVYVLRSEFSLRLTPDQGEAYGKETLRRGEQRFTVFTFDTAEPAIIPPLGDYADDLLDTTIEYWQDWTSRCTYDGQHKEQVVRSLLTLKMMTFAESGALVAAPTTSLPETIGGERNWDYRYCWLRDATMTLNAIVSLGYFEEGEAFLFWLLQATRITLPDLSVMYDVFGNAADEERNLDHLEGYRRSSPVRVGNLAKDQLQLDMYGEVVIAAYDYVHMGERSLTRLQSKMLSELGDAVCDKWRQPDEGIWEVRSGPQQNTYSKAMCWVALDRLVSLHEEDYIKVDVDRFVRERDAIREMVETKGYNESLESYTMTLEGEHLDASLLLMAIEGYIEPNHPRMRSTWECIQERLGRDGLIYRYDAEDGLPKTKGHEGAFGMCCFWATEYLARCGEVEKAEAHFEELLEYANDLGLYAEEIEPETGDALGNFPQAFTHIGLINSALQIQRARGEITADETLHD